MSSRHTAPITWGKLMPNRDTTYGLADGNSVEDGGMVFWFCQKVEGVDYWTVEAWDESERIENDNPLGMVYMTLSQLRFVAETCGLTLVLVEDGGNDGQ